MKYARIDIRIKEEDKKILKNLAVQENRSLSNYLIMEGLKKNKK